MATALVRPGDRPLLHVALLGLTVCTTFFTFLFVLEPEGDGSPMLARALGTPGHHALAFALSLVAILGAHEMGHYLLARWHGVDTSLPYFIPVPFLGVGTLGAVIRIRGPIPHRNALVDIGAAGPLAGLLVAIPVLVLGLARSHWVDAPDLRVTLPGELSLWNVSQAVVGWAGRKLHWLPDAPPVAESANIAIVYGDSLLKTLLQAVVRGPTPAGKMLDPHPLVVAGWFGLLVTMLNLIPVGQLDGGHLTFALFGRRAQLLGRVAAAGLLALCVFVSAGWMLWLVVTTFAVGFRHPPVEDAGAPLSRGRRWICGLCLAALVLCLMPLPLREVALP